MFFVFNSNPQVTLCIYALFIMAAIIIYFHKTEIVGGASHFGPFDMYCACICTNYRLVLTFAVEVC